MNTIDPDNKSTDMDEFKADSTVTTNHMKESNQFITTWKTTVDNESITIPCDDDFEFDFTIEWGDGTIDNNVTGSITHIYTTSGIHTVKISGLFPAIQFMNQGSKDKILRVEQWGKIAWRSMYNAFHGCINLQIPATDAPDLSNVTSMQNMLRDAKMFNEPIDHWDVSNVTNMYGLFSDASVFNQNIESWNVSNVTRMDYMFRNAVAFNQPLDVWEERVGNVIFLLGMFKGAIKYNKNIENWKLNNVVWLYQMFENASSFNQNIGSWDVSKVTAMNSIFSGTAISTENYDNILLGWAEQVLQNDVTLDANNLTFCKGENARNKIIQDFGWTINDNGKDCEVVYILENNTEIASDILEVGKLINNETIGSITIRNNQTIPITITKGTSLTQVIGLEFKTASTITITENGGEVSVGIVMSGTPTNTGTFSEVISIENVENPANFTLDFVVNEQTGIIINEKTYVQSSFLYLQATGSNGNDSTPGRHLRWAFKGALGEKHLPKANQASGTDNFNKPNDFVKISRTLYQPYKTTLDFVTSSPKVVDNGNFLWIYRIDKKDIYIRFKDHAKYNDVLNTTDPLTQSYQFIQNYGNRLIEIENVSSLFFAVGFSFTNVNSNSVFKIETLSVEENKITADKVVSNRNTFTQLELAELHLICENGRSIRLQQSNVQVSTIDFEFYSDFILGINNSSGWEEMGSYALTLDDTTAFSQLEQNAGDVHGVWQRFNDNAFVNIQNYQDKWNNSPEEGDRNIKMIVDKYIELSNDASNPTAIETIQLENDPNDPNDTIQISNLDLLNLAANDYHIARLLGLGILDVDREEESYVYIAAYTTFADLEDGLGARDVDHVFMSLPTSINDSRLPLPINLNKLSFGLQNNEEGTSLTDEEGYTADGLSRYIRLYSEELPKPNINTPFFISDDEVNLSTLTPPIFGGLEHKIGTGNWQKPELSHDKAYYNEVPIGEDPHFETRYLLIPEPQMSYYIHRQRISGQHIYEAYGINWFSRATRSSLQLTTDTLLKQINPLKPPSSTNALLIREESPLLLTSQEEQDRLNTITDDDKTLIRLSFNYHAAQELKDYRLDSGSTVTNEQIVNPNNADNPAILFPDNQEIFADEIEVFFRQSIPNNVNGKALEVTNHSTEETLSIINTGEYTIASSGDKLTPYIETGTESNYIGGVFIIGENKYVIFEVTQGTDYPIFTVYKKEISDAILAGNSPSSVTYEELEAPIITSDGLFMAIENMQNMSSWGTPNPLGLKVNVENEWPIHREIIELTTDDGVIERHVEKTRGIWEEANISEELEPDPNNSGNTIFQGLYKIEFNDFTLEQHEQFNESDISVEWFRGSIRVFTENSILNGTPNNTRKIVSVLRIENISTSGNPTTENLIVYAQDPTFNHEDPEYDTIQTGSNIEVNFYPGYKVYLYENTSYGIDEQNILPKEGEGLSHSIFGFRSMMNDCNESDSCYSKISVPNIMIAEEIIEAETPELPSGSLYATRPDFFGRSTYTITTKFNHKPHGVLFYRTNEEALLNVLYEKQTVLQIRESLKVLGGNNEEYLVNRWNNFLNFDELSNDGDFKVYPPSDVSENAYKFPNPDKQAFFDWVNSILEALGHDLITESPGILSVGDPKILNFVKGAIYNAFVPLTEMPIIFKYLKGKDKKVEDKPQVIRDSNGGIISPFDPKDLSQTDTGFRMAPMTKIINMTPEDSYNEVLFTDFKLDGTSNNIYFYGVKELSSKLKMSEFSPFLGPIKLVNTKAAETPEIKRIIPILRNDVLGVTPKISIEVNAYPEVQNIKKLTIYRSSNRLDAQSILSMQAVKTIDLEESNLLGESIWSALDEFDDLPEIPYGEGLFYRVVALREIEYADADGNIITDYAPSEASKIIASMLVETKSPVSPTLKYYSEPINANGELYNVLLQWNKTVYNGKYHLYKMNAQGNWVKIYEISSNDAIIQVRLEETDYSSDIIRTLDEKGNQVFHHFKVISENTSGMLSIETNILTMYDEDTWNNILDI